jgi:hypothetical protein
MSVEKLTKDEKQAVKDEADAEKAFQKGQRDSGGPNPQLDAEAAKDPRVHPVGTMQASEDLPVLTDEEIVKGNLTEEEATALVLAEAKRRHAEKIAKGETDAQTEAETKARAERVAAPLDYIGLDLGKNGSYAYMKLTHPPIAPERTIRIAGVTYEHVHEDADGIWLYQHLG